MKRWINYEDLHSVFVCSFLKHWTAAHLHNISQKDLFQTLEWCYKVSKKSLPKVRLWVRISAPAGIVHDWGETLEQVTEPPTTPRAPQHWLPTAPGVCALGWVKCRAHFSLLVILCIIVYVTNKKILLLLKNMLLNVVFSRAVRWSSIYYKEP